MFFQHKKAPVDQTRKQIILNYTKINRMMTKKYVHNKDKNTPRDEDSMFESHHESSKGNDQEVVSKFSKILMSINTSKLSSV